MAVAKFMGSTIVFNGKSDFDPAWTYI